MMNTAKRAAIMEGGGGIEKWKQIYYAEKFELKAGQPAPIKVGGLLRTITRPTLNRLLLLRASVCMCSHPEGKLCSDLGLVLVLNDPPARN